jgi:hypothetical protein
MLRKILLTFMCFSTLVIATGCNMQADVETTAKAVDRMHSQMDGEKFQEIYSQADDGLRSASKQQDFLNLMGAIHRKLGKVQNASRRAFFVNWTTSGEQVRVNYNTKFEGGDAQEQFVWHVSGTDAKLLGYHINSDALILK